MVRMGETRRGVSFVVVMGPAVVAAAGPREIYSASTSSIVGSPSGASAP